MFYVPVYTKERPKYVIQFDNSWLVYLHHRIESNLNEFDGIKLQKLRTIYLKLYGRLPEEEGYSDLVSMYVKVYKEPRQ